MNFRGMFFQKNNNKELENPIVTKQIVFVLISLLFSISVYYFTIVPFIMQWHLSHDNTKALLDQLKQVSFLNEGNFNPEVLEKRLFYGGIISISFIITTLILLIKYIDSQKIAQKINYDIIYKILISVSITIIIIWGYRFLNEVDMYTNLSNFDFYLQDSWVKKYVYLYLVLVLILVIVIIQHNKHNMNIFIDNKSQQMFVDIVIILLIIYMFNNMIFDYPIIQNLFHFNAVFYSQQQVNLGVLIGKDGFVNTYGMYPIYLLPIFKLLGTSILNFSVVMALLLNVSFLLVYITLRKLIKHKIVLLLSSIAFIYMDYLFGKIVTHDYYFQYHPLRFIFPCIAIYFAYKIAFENSKKIYYASIFILPHACLWSPDSGIATNVAWMAFLIYYNVDVNSVRKSVSNITKSLLFYVGGALISILLLQIIVKISYNDFLPLKPYFSFILFFSKFGYWFLPMPKLHLWNIYIVIVFICLSFAIVNILMKRDKNISSFVFFISLLMLGLFIYYTGRSHTLTFTTVQGYIYIPIAIFLNYLILYYKKIQDKFNYTINNVLIYVGLLTMVFPIFAVLFHIFSNTKYFEPMNESKQFAIEQAQIIKNNIGEDKELLILFRDHQALLHYETQTISPFNPGIIDLFLKADLDRLKNNISKAQYKYIYVDINLYSLLQLNSNDFNQYKITFKKDNLYFFTKNNLN